MHRFVFSLWKYFSFEIQQKRNISQWQIFGSMQKCIEIRTPFRNWCCHNFPDSHLLHYSQFHNLHVIGLYKLFCLGLIGFFFEDILWKAFSFTPHRPFRLPTGVSWYKSWQANYSTSGFVCLPVIPNSHTWAQWGHRNSCLILISGSFTIFCR